MQHSKSAKSSQVSLTEHLLNIHIVLMQVNKESNVADKARRLFGYKKWHKIKICKLQFSEIMFDGRNQLPPVIS